MENDLNIKSFRWGELSCVVGFGKPYFVPKGPGQLKPFVTPHLGQSEEGRK
jgi:hypothetical protein